MQLYHFTRLATLQNILLEGIARGECPIDGQTYFPALNFTKDPSPKSLTGVFGAFEDHRRSKVSVRLKVSIPKEDHNLYRWKDVPKVFRIEGRVYRALNKCCRGNPVYDWFIYTGVIPPAWFIEVAVFDSPANDSARVFTLPELEAIRALPLVPDHMMVRVPGRQITPEQAKILTHAV
jgi:hypothetical protein